MNTARRSLLTLIFAFGVGTVAAPWLIPACLAMPSTQTSEASGGSAPARHIGSIKAIAANVITLAPDSGPEIAVTVQATARIVEGPIAPTASPTLLDLTHRLSRRYLGPDGPRYAEKTLGRPRVLVRLEPVSWTSWTGQEWHPRYR